MLCSNWLSNKQADVGGYLLNRRTRGRKIVAKWHRLGFDADKSYLEASGALNWRRATL